MTASVSPAPAVEAQATTGARLWAWLGRTGILVPVAWLLLLLWRAPHLDPHDWDYDEGINLMKALLVQLGHPMFTEVWSDQPPLLTVTLAGLFQATGPSVAAARLLVMVLSAVLLWAFYLTLRASFPTWIALLATVMLALSEFYLRLSGAVMVGLPSVALAMVSIALLATGKPAWARLTLSALVMALALQTKLLTALVVPSAVVAILVAAWAAGWRERITRVLGWGLVLGAAYLVLGFALGALRFDLLFGTHFSSMTRNLEDFIEGSTLFFPHLIEQHVAYLLVGAAGLVYAARQRRAVALVPLSWIVVGAAAFSVHRPLWYHHTIILTLPLTWLCAYGIAGWWQWLRSAWAKSRQAQGTAAFAAAIATAVAVLAIWWFYPNPYPERLHWQMTVFRPNYVAAAAGQLITDSAAWQAAQAGEDEPEQTWVFTDHPFYAFQAGLPVPPPIAVLSRKSLETGIITQDMLARVVREYKPQFVLLDRFTGSYSPAVIDYFNRGYDLAVDSDNTKYYVRRND